MRVDRWQVAKWTAVRPNPSACSRRPTIGAVLLTAALATAACGDQFDGSSAATGNPTTTTTTVAAAAVSPAGATTAEWPMFASIPQLAAKSKAVVRGTVTTVDNAMLRGPGAPDTRRSSAERR